MCATAGVCPRGMSRKASGSRKRRCARCAKRPVWKDKLVRKLGDIRYSYRDKTKDGEPIRIYKRVHFYLMRYVRGDVRDHDHEVGRRALVSY